MTARRSPPSAATCARRASPTAPRSSAPTSGARSASWATSDRQFSWVFLDPPYVKETDGVLAELSGGDLLTACAVVIVEHDKRHPSPPSVGCLFLTDRRNYGDTELSFYRCSGS